VRKARQRSDLTYSPHSVRSCRSATQRPGFQPKPALPRLAWRVFFVPIQRARKHYSASQLLAADALHVHGTPRLASYALTVSLFCLGRSGHPRPTFTAPWTRSCIKIHQISDSKTVSTTYTFYARGLEPFMKMLRSYMPVLCAGCANDSHTHKPSHWITYASLHFAVAIERGIVHIYGDCVENCAHPMFELLVCLHGTPRRQEDRETLRIQLVQPLRTASRAEGLISFFRCASQHRALDQASGGVSTALRRNVGSAGNQRLCGRQRAEKTPGV
jgi:hypothetical protein